MQLMLLFLVQPNRGNGITSFIILSFLFPSPIFKHSVGSFFLSSACSPSNMGLRNFYHASLIAQPISKNKPRFKWPKTLTSLFFFFVEKTHQSN